MISQSKIREIDAGEIMCDPRSAVVGGGSFGMVLLGEHKSLNKVAAKILTAQGGEKDMRLIKNTILNEFGKLQTAQCENVVRTYGWTMLSCSMGLVTEYCAGGNLRQLLLDHNLGIKIPLRLRMLKETMDAVVFFHEFPEKPLVHDDLKLENILVTHDLHAKVADFGSARLAAVTGSTTIRAPVEGKKIQFTAEYTAPEKLANITMKPKKEHDVYSTGVMTHMFIFRESPYPVMNALILQNAIINGTRPDCDEIEDLKASLGDGDREILTTMDEEMKRCWDQDPMKRPPMREVRDRYQRLLDKHNPADILQHVVDSVRQMDLNDPISTNQGQLVPLHQFSTLTGKFHSSEAGNPERSSDVSSASRDNQQGQSQHDVSNVKMSSTQQHVTSLPRQQGDVTHLTLEQVFQQRGETNDKTQLVEKYCKQLKDGKYIEANFTKQQLSRLIEAGIKTTAKHLRAFANKNRTEKRFLEALLFFQISTDFYAKNSNPKLAAKGFKDGAYGLRDTNMEMVESDVTCKPIVGEYVISLIKDIRQQIENLANVDDKLRTVCVAECIHAVEVSLGLIDFLQLMEETINEGLELMRRKFGADAVKYQVYGHLLNNLGVVCVKTSRFRDAIKYNREAIQAYRMAEDINTEEKRLKVIKNSENNLEINEAKLDKQ